MTCKRVTREERRFICCWSQEGCGVREIARRLGKAASSISRELRRNRGRRGYRPRQAHWEAQKRARRPGPRRFTGREFARHEELARATGMDVFFARPYHSWERGTNENANGLIRRLHPRGSSFADIDGPALWRIERFLNDRPRRYLGWQTPREALAAFLAAAP